MQIRPAPDRASGGLFPVYDEDQCRRDLASSTGNGWFLSRRVKRYFATMQFSTADAGVTYTDGKGADFTLSPATASVESLNLCGPDHTSSPKPYQDVRKWLVFRDPVGTVTLVAPGYGWDWSAQLDPWAAQNGWQVRLGMDEVENDWRGVCALDPSMGRAPLLRVGLGLKTTGSPRTWRQ